MPTKQLNNLTPQLKVPFFHRGLTLKVMCISESCIEIQIKLNVLWCLKRFFVVPQTVKAFIKPFEAPQRSVKIKI